MLWGGNIRCWVLVPWCSMLCGKAPATYGLMHVSYSAGYQATYHKISPPIAPGFGIPAIIIHSVPALGAGELLLFYKQATATQLF